MDPNLYLKLVIEAQWDLSFVTYTSRPLREGGQPEVLGKRELEMARNKLNAILVQLD